MEVSKIWRPRVHHDSLGCAVPRVMDFQFFMLELKGRLKMKE